MLLGEILVKEGYCDQADIILALNDQQAGDDRKLGEILVSSHIISYLDLVIALSMQDEIREKQIIAA
ncbi:MAG: hypothetical protein ACLFSQ_09285 [Candidatus Zixiibacteriota bacterium]